ncbi:LysR family transcriptional regulator [Xanthobacter autotrophicus]|uniref:LysR family transcriptional regulator n=1 Tax=Xanthobacter autotrophicus TaxID=280 RepID=UPI0024A6ABCE|nr:LysR family transcriptional regulator [Xanthobacter autotrophicus]MDI4655700.1 LysR family transcriptional regulator [Xanthobacter autotrophicus]
MDRIDAMTAFVAALDEGSLARAARRLGRSPAAITRAVAQLEEHLGTRLLHRTTRALHLTHAGELYLASSRAILADLAEADLLAAGERTDPRGVLSVTAPVTFGRLHVAPVIEDLIEAHPALEARLLLVDRVVNLVDEGHDAAVRIGHLPDSSLVATRVGEVRRVVCASPDYLVASGTPGVPSDLSTHRVISFSQITETAVWAFAAGPSGGARKQVSVDARFTVNSADAAIAAAARGRGITRVLSYQVEEAVAAGHLRLVLEEFEGEPLPVHVVYPGARLQAAKLRAFVDFAVPRLRARLAELPVSSERA